jgi:hypothetical protein
MTPSDMCDMGAKHDKVKKTNRARGRLGKKNCNITSRDCKYMNGNIMYGVKLGQVGFTRVGHL